jgi:hypothetical protein
MNPTYEKIAKAIRTNTLKNRFSTTQVIDKRGLVTFLSDHFRTTDTLFIADDFVKLCEEAE